MDNVDDADSVVGNEYNTAFSVVGSNLRLTDGGGNIDVPLTSLGTDDQNAGEVAVTPAGNITATEVQSALEELDAAILSGELTTTVAAGTGIDVSSTTVGNNTEYTVTVDPTDIIGDGGITSGDIDVTGGANSTLNDVGLTIADNAITNAKMADDAITTAELATGAVESGDILDGTIATLDIADDAVALEKLANGTSTGQVMQWDGSEWTLVDLGSVTVTENDGIIGNEVVGASNGSLTLTGAGTTVNPFRLEVSGDGITTNEIATGAVESNDILDGTIATGDLADGAVTLDKMADGANVGELIQWNGTDWVYIDASTLDTDDQDLSNTVLTANESVRIDITDGSSTTIDIRDADSSVTNEVNTAFNVASGNLNITDSNGTLSVPLGSIDTDTDDQTLSISGDQLSISEGNTVTLPGADGTETIVEAGNANVTVTGDGSSGSPYQISSVDNVDDADSVVGNEYNTAFSVVGSNLRLTDGGGNIDVPLTSIGTDTQDLSIDATGRIISLGWRIGDDQCQ